MKELVSVVIPILNPQINPTEEKLLHHCLETLQNYPLIFITYQGADLSIIKEHNEEIDVIYFPEKYFRSRNELARLFLLEEFYERFNWCEFLLIHELNSWVIKDELHYWCKQGYDYLKAAPLLNPQATNANSVFRRTLGLKEDEKILFGNGYTDNGIYLCRIERMIDTLKSKKREAYVYRHDDVLTHADSVFWDIEANRFLPHLRKPSEIVRSYFAVDALNLNQTKSLPFALTGITRSNIQDLSYFKEMPEAD